jgi:hypothetical protein
VRADGPLVRTDPVVAACAVAGAVGVAASGTAATGEPLLDLLWAGALGFVVPCAASRASRWTLLIPAAVGAGLIAPGAWPLAAAAVVVALIATVVSDASPRWAAASGLASVLALVHLEPRGFYGLPSLIAGAALLPLLATAWRNRTPRDRPVSASERRIRRGAVAVLGVCVLASVAALAYGGWYLAAGTRQADAGSLAAAEGRSEAAADELRDSAASFRRTEAAFGSWLLLPGRAVPVLSQHLQTVEDTAREATVVADATAGLIDTADYRSLRSDAGRFDLSQISALQEPIVAVKETIDEANQRVAERRSPWLLPPAGAAIDRFEDKLAGASSDLSLARDTVRVAPDLLGGDGERHHLVLFVTPAELRGSGGFIGSYAELSADDGHLELVRTGSAGSLEQAAPPGGAVLTGPPDYLARYGHLQPGKYFRDLTFSPNFPDDADAVRQAYEQINGVEVDTVTTVDPVALAALLEVIGPVYVPKFGRTLDADNAASFLLSENYAQFPDDAAQTEALSQLVEVVFDRLTTGDLPGPSAFSNALHGPASEGRVRMWSPDPAEQALFERIGVSGAFPAPSEARDFLSVATQNSGNNKLDIYQHRSVEYQVEIGDDGKLHATATIRIRNATPLDAGLSEYVAGNRQGDPLGTNRMLVSVYSPHQIDGARLDGKDVGVSAQEEAGFRVYTRQVVVAPGDSVVLEIDLLGTAPTTGPYVLDHVAQPMLEPQDLRVELRRDGDVEGEVTTQPAGRQVITIDDGSATIRAAER